MDLRAKRKSFDELNEGEEEKIQLWKVFKSLSAHCPHASEKIRRGGSVSVLVL
jgi:hypothetical protein